jgi:hypothetical protein
LVWIKGGDHYLESDHLNQAVDAIHSWLEDRGFAA